MAVGIAAALPMDASAQTKPKPKPAELYIDVATHAMPGMPGMGSIGRMANAMSGQTASYGMARSPGMAGKYLDIALHNRQHPGTPASQFVPKGLRVGERIELLPSPRGAAAPLADSPPAHQMPADGGTFRMRYYWGCGEQVRAGQPAEYTVTIRNGKPVQSGRAPTPRQVPSSGIDPGPQHVLWPNPSSRKTVSAKASLVGTHRVTGEGLPETMQFELAHDHDFMPALKLRSESKAEQGPTLHWDAVDGARAYFIHGTAMDGDTIVMWSSSQDGYAGPELIGYLPEKQIAQWTGSRTLLNADARSCSIPREVFAGNGNAAPVLQMIAYGSERTISQAGWNVHVRNKSTAMLMSFGAGAPGASPLPVKDAAKGLLRGLIGR
ncbi:hypothetical protein ASG75_12770 [Rhodanobacter sp. Soil772]|nr:hypothetical protein ASG75_12770 [Rhodanobacter sp. Soil772]